MSDTILDDLSELKHVFGYLPLRYGCFLISLFGLVSGIIGLTCILLYGIGAFNFMFYFVTTPNEDAKKATIATLGFISFFTTIKNALFMSGVLTKSTTLIFGYVCAALIMISVMFVVFTCAPLCCFFGVKTCLLDAFSYGNFLFAIILFSICISSWTYFMIIGNSLRMEWN